MDSLISFTSTIGNFMIGTLLPFFAVLLVVVFIHEMGHYLVGRWCGIGIRAFSIGFGPEILGFDDKRGTRWKLCAIPLGGYVKFVGDVGATSAPDGDELLALPAEERASAFQVQALWKKALTVVAGPVANFILAIFILTCFFVFLGKQETAPIVGSVEPNSPAAAAQIQPGDRFVEVAGREVKAMRDMQHVVTARAGDELEFVLVRDGQRINVKMTPELKEIKDALGNPIKLGLVGIVADKSEANFKRISLTPIEALNEGWLETVRTIERTLIFLKRFAGGREDRCQLGGPVKIAKMAGQAAEQGIDWVITLAAFLSIGIGIMNLLPIPPLDGGHLALYGVEAVVRRPLPSRATEWLYKIGFMLVLMFFAFVFYNDIFAC
jgi:regulator of sigma E protease